MPIGKPVLGKRHAWTRLEVEWLQARKDAGGHYSDSVDDFEREFGWRPTSRQFDARMYSGKGLKFSDVGTETTLKNCGLKLVKIGNDKDGKSLRTTKNRYVYEQAKGPVPEGCIVVFADRDKENYDPANLIAVDRREMMVIHKMGIGYHDAESLELAVLTARMVRKKRTKVFEHRICDVCGAVFSADVSKGNPPKRCPECRRKRRCS